MKKILNIACLIAGIMFLSNMPATAQDGQIKIGGGLVLSTGALELDEIDNGLGIKLDGIYTINEEFRAGADLTFYFPQEEGDIKASVFGINLNGNYIFYAEEQLTAYGLAGINIAIVTVDVPEQTIGGQTFGGKDSESEIGLNLGAGLEYAVDFGDIFGELKFAGIGGDADQLVLGAGVRFPIQ